MSDEPERSRFPHSVYGQGAEPDPRFSLANERTFLAWIRTSLALGAAAIALEALGLPIERPVRAGGAAVLAALAVLAAVQAWRGWARTERALRLGRALPGPSVAIVLSVGVILAVVAVTVGMLV